jgi:hypothetical protein
MSACVDLTRLVKSFQDLLRKYGFVDEANEHNIVEISGQFVVDTILQDEFTRKDKVINYHVCCMPLLDLMNYWLLRDFQVDFLLEEGILDEYVGILSFEAIKSDCCEQTILRDLSAYLL